MQANPGEFDHQTDDEVRAGIEILPNYGTKDQGKRRQRLRAGGNASREPCASPASRARGASRRRFSQRVRGRDAGKPHMSAPNIYWVVW
jgi:hypothetical protein